MNNRNNHPSDRSPNQPSSAKQGRGKIIVPLEIQSEILRLHAYYGTREIAPRVGYSRKIVRRVLSEQGCLAPGQPPRKPGKLAPFRQMIEEKVRKDLTVTRIMREIREQGYTGEGAFSPSM